MYSFLCAFLSSPFIIFLSSPHLSLLSSPPLVFLSSPHLSLLSSPLLSSAGRRAVMPPSPTSCGAASRGAPRTRPLLWPSREAPCWACPTTPPASRSTSP
ncbi:hypothetical protein VZT92_027872 [Zoarces viviparus]|uniref:Secreted protein n=1 Tax=Zoarces viviparus TaxID=48416 RepID=A0AAW1DY96_ZOAVI